MNNRLVSVFFIILMIITGLSISSTVDPELRDLDVQNQPTLVEQLKQGITDKTTSEIRSVMQSETSNLPSLDSVMVFTSSPTIDTGGILPALNIGNLSIHTLDNPSPTQLRELYLDKSVELILPDYQINYTSQQTIPDLGSNTESFIADDILGTESVYDEFGYTGKGVTVGVVDSGVDFGISDLKNSAILSQDGYLDSLDITGTGLAISSLTIQPILSRGEEILPLDGEVLDVFIGEQNNIQTTQDLGIQLEDLYIDNLSVPSVSGNYKVGIAYQGSIVQTLPSQYFLFVLVDSTEAGVYDTIFVDMETSLAISLVQEGIILSGSQFFREISEYNLTNDEPFGAGNPIIAKDINGDGINDISMGGLATTIDFTGVTDSLLVEGILPSGDGIATMFDSVGHGTLVASSAAADGNSTHPIFDDKTTQDVENSTNYRLSGSAPEAKIIAHKAFTISDFLWGWSWTGGLRFVEDRGRILFEGDSSLTVDISQNSWGNGQVAPDNVLKGFDILSLLLDAYTLPNTLFEGYPGTIFVVSGGNGAPGWGTTATPGSASMALTIGSSTYYHFLNGSTGRNDVAWFSGRGPSSYGTIKPDVVTPSHTGFVHHQVIQGYGNGTYAYGTFGGTSEAAPRATGVVALMIEAMRDHNINPSYEKIRTILKSTATDLGFHPAQQGAGLINATKAINAIVNNELLYYSPHSSQLAGDRLQPAFDATFASDIDHPLFNNHLGDPMTTITQGMLSEGISINLENSNGTTINADDYQHQVGVQALGHEDSFEYQSNQIRNEVSLSGILPETLDDYQFMELSITIQEESWEILTQSGLETPNMVLYDPSSGDIVSDLTSFATWSQLIFSGNPNDDFSGTPHLLFDDPGFVESISGWQGLQLEISVRLFELQSTAILTTAENDNQIHIQSDEDFADTQVFTLSVSRGSDQVTIPLVVIPEYQAGFAEDITSVGDSSNLTQSYSQTIVSNTFDWGYRPESGDFNHYQISVPSSATYFATYAKWTDNGIQPNMYLFNSTGNLIAKSDVEYIGGGFYEASTSENQSQNLLVEATDTQYYLLIHTTELPHEVGPYSIDVRFRYLDLPSLPTPIPTYSQDIDELISNDLVIDVSNYSIDQFPEFRITEIDAQVYQGSNGTVNRTIAEGDLIEGPNLTFDENEFEDRIDLDFNQGEKVVLELSWDGDLDLDFYVFGPGSIIFQGNDLLSGLGSSPGTSPEQGLFAVEETGTYVILVDYVVGNQDGSAIDYSLSYESRDGPTIHADENILNLPTIIFPDDTYGVLLTFYSNFGFEFTRHISITTDNHQDFSIGITSPETGSTQTGDILVSWETDNQNIVVDVFLVIDGTTILLGSRGSSSSLTFDSTLYPNGPAEIVIEATDLISVERDMVTIIIDNSSPLSLLDPTTSNSQSLGWNWFLVISVAVTAMIHRRRSTYNQK